ncbi:MAG: aminopeptidase P family protein [Deltaproteobacteria bacterium]|jgi:Xaa-Pro aminopeptidase|nr:aminopeptidase P family protein [Deltaproteobacteria bacterium]
MPPKTLPKTLKETPTPYASRLKALRGQMKERGIPNLLILSSANRRYFSGFLARDAMIAESAGSLLITPDAQYLLTDSRYLIEAQNEAPLFETVLTTKGLVDSLTELGSFAEGLGYEADYLTVFHFLKLTKALGEVLRPWPGSLGTLRASKDASEISLIKKALEIAEKAVGLLWDNLEPGWTEGQAAWFLDRTFRDLGAEGSSFETIVAAGPRAALPHAVPGSKVIEKGEMVVVDCGAFYEGYASDITRTIVLGPPKAWQKKIYRVVREAQQKALDFLAPGKTGAEVHKVAFDHIAKNGYGDYFGHSLGHGVGLAIHEPPNLSPFNKEPLPVGAVVTVEPGIYLPDQGGVRLEQMAVLTKTGCLLLNEDNHFYDF